MDIDLFEVDIKERSIRKLTEHEGNVRYLSPTYSADGKSIYCACDQERDLSTLARIDLSNLQHDFLQETAYEIEYVATSPDGHWLLWLSNVEGAHQFSLLDLHTNETRQPEHIPLGVTIDNTAPVFSHDSRRIAFSFSTPVRTPDIWVWEIEENRVFPVTRSSHAGISISSFREPELIHYPSFDHLSIPAWFYRPARSSAEKYPILVNVHGGPEGQRSRFSITRFSILFPEALESPGVD